MKKLIVILAAIVLTSCNTKNCDTCITEDSHPNNSVPKTGVVTKVMLNGYGETSQSFVIYFEDESGNERNYESKTLALPGDTITWY